MRENAKAAVLTPTPGVACSRRPMIPMNHMKQGLTEQILTEQVGQQTGFKIMQIASEKMLKFTPSRQS